MSIAETANKWPHRNGDSGWQGGSIILFIAVVLIVIAVAHFIVYEGLVFGFHIIDADSLRIIGYVLIFLSISFVLSSLIGARYNNPYTQAFYYLAAVWLGALTYFTLAGFTLIVVFTIVYPPDYLEYLLFGLSAIASLYGVFNAARIRIKEYTIEIPNLDSRWHGRKAVVVSDFHTGQIYGRNFIEKIVGIINELHPDIVFIVGDVFDGLKLDADNVLEPLKSLNIPRGIYAVLGNHEEFRESSYFVEAMQRAGIKVLIDEKFEIDGLEIVGADYESTDAGDDYDRILQVLRPDVTKPAILLRHVPNHIEIAVKYGISLQFSGHTHKAQMWPFNLLTPMIFKGFDYGLKRFEKTQVLTTSGAGTWGPPMRVGTQSEVVVVTFG